jgi:hypothetical protein
MPPPPVARQQKRRKILIIFFVDALIPCYCTSYAASKKCDFAQKKKPELFNSGLCESVVKKITKLSKPTNSAKPKLI